VLKEDTDIDYISFDGRRGRIKAFIDDTKAIKAVGGCVRKLEMQEITSV